MVSRSLLLVLLVLGCLQSFTAAQSAHEPDQCCFSYQKKPIPVQHIKEYKITRYDCTKPGVILILKDGRHTCANPKDEWVKNIMEKIDQHLKP
ncbi:hypothetical protein AMELA_G00057650 [Ameiurus melas]|uniref:C-C motif chemokine n=1 Tax=Ameiurus melas TaxID=219545 RepID=A0A7J6B2V6_AMEME|nr:hypothetical protein AMELA_G00057650 [Ameiurus melas]